MEACAALRGSADGDPTYLDMVVRGLRPGAARAAPRQLELPRRAPAPALARQHRRDPRRDADMPTVFDADARASRRSRARPPSSPRRPRRADRPAQLAGATFTVADLGCTPSPSFAAIVNPLQAAILVGRLRRPAGRRVREGSRLARRHADADARLRPPHPRRSHAARFLARIRELLEAPSAPLRRSRRAHGGAAR